MTLSSTTRRIAADAVVLVVLAVAGLYGAAAVGATLGADAGYDYGDQAAFVHGAGPAGYSATAETTGHAAGTFDYGSAGAFAHGAGPAGYSAR